MSVPIDTARTPNSWRRVVGDALRFDRSGITVVDATRMAIGTSIPLVIGHLAGSWASGAAAAGGALAVGIGSVVPSPRPRIAALGSTAVGMAVATFVGSATSAHPAVHVVVGALMAAVCGLLVAVEPLQAGAGINTLMAFLVYGRFSAAPAIAARTAGLVAAGAVLQLLIAIVLWRRPKAGRALAGLSRAYTTLAEFAADLRVGHSSLPAAQALDAAMTDLNFSFRADVAREAWTALVAEAHRVRLELLSLASARSSFDRADVDARSLIERVGDSASAFLRCVAESLGRAEVSADCDGALDEVERAIGDLTMRAEGKAGSGGFPDGGAISTHDGAGFVVVRAVTASHALAGQLRAIDALIRAAVRASDRTPIGVAAIRSARRISGRGVRGAGALAQRMAANITPRSDAFRHAVRLALVVTVATALAHAVDLGRGYWLALTAVLVLRPEFAITFTRGVARALGTLLGVVVATAIAVLANPHGWALVVFVAVFVWLSGALFNASYAVFSVVITGVVVFLLAGIDQHPVATGEDRLLATVLGAGLALVAYVAWPTWGRRPASDAVADLAESTHRYVIATLRSYLEPNDSSALAALSALSRQVRLARTNAESSLGRSLADPGSRRIDPQATAEILAALRRLSIAAHTLRLRRPREADALPRWQFGQLVDALDTELNAAAARLRFGRITLRHEPLRDRQLDLFVASSARRDDVMALILAETDELVDATNSLSAVLDRHNEPLLLDAAHTARSRR